MERSKRTNSEISCKAFEENGQLRQCIQTDMAGDGGGGATRRVKGVGTSLRSVYKDLCSGVPRRVARAEEGNIGLYVHGNH